MITDLSSRNYEHIKDEDTGSHDEYGEFRIIEYPFDKYQIKIMLNTQNKFISIEEIKLDKEFISNKEKILSFSQDDSQYYED